jgi:arginyl-tRNA synthetase
MPIVWLFWKPREIPKHHLILVNSHPATTVHEPIYMKTKESLLADKLSEAIFALYQQRVDVATLQFQETRKEFEGDITVVVFPLVKISKKSPEATGQEIGHYLQTHVAEITAFQVVKGFLNISLSNTYWLQVFQAILSANRFGFSEPQSKPRVMVEYSSPNTNKPLHLGHLRNNFLGYSVAEILKANGHSVTKVQIINDRGIHICKSMLAWKKFGEGETPESSAIKGDKLVGKYYVAFESHYRPQVKALMEQGMSEDEAKKEAPLMKEAQDMLLKWEQKDPETVALWKNMNQWVYDGFNSTYTAMGVDFDKLYYESNTYLLGKQEVENGLRDGIFFQKEDGSIWVDLTDEGLDQKALLRKDGTAMYITQDIGTAILRFNDFPDTAYQIYTVGNEQEYHFKVLFKILKRLGFTQADKCFHLSYGMVELPEGKMKSREGTVVDADDLMHEMAEIAKATAEEQGKLENMDDAAKAALHHTIGMAALKYFLLRVDPIKNMLFDPKSSIDFNGQTGPFIQYTHVRTLAIGRKYNDQFGSIESLIAPIELHPGPLELDVIKKLYDWPTVLQKAARTYDPSQIANYCYDLARTYNAFYQNSHIIRENDSVLRLFRMLLTQKTGDLLRDAMSLLGIQMPERM